MSVYLQTWCKGSICDPCEHCYWQPMAGGIGPPTDTIPWILDEDGNIDRTKNFCLGSPYFLGIAARTSELTADSKVGDLVRGYIDLTMQGLLASTSSTPPTAPPLLPDSSWITVAGETVLTFDPTDVESTIENFTAVAVPTFYSSTGGPVYTYSWLCANRHFYEGCILRNLSVPSDTNYNCVLPLAYAVPAVLGSTDASFVPVWNDAPHKSAHRDPVTLYEYVAFVLVPRTTAPLTVDSGDEHAFVDVRLNLVFTQLVTV